MKSLFANFSRTTAFLLISLLWCGCGATVTTRMDRPRVAVSGRAEIAALLGRGALRGDPGEAARKLEAWAGRDPGRLAEASEMVLGLVRPGAKNGAGLALTAARLAWESLRGSGRPASRWLKENPRAVAAYNGALAAFADAASKELAAGRFGPVQTPGGPVVPEVKYETGPPVRAGYFDDLLVSGRVSIRGIRTRATVDGFGVALVGRRQVLPERAEEMQNHPARGISMAVSCVAEFSRDGRVVLKVWDPIRTPEAPVRGSVIPLAADFTAPLALSMGGINDLLLGIRNMFNVSAGAVDAGVYLVDPCDQNRTPVLLIHGLSSTPIVWRNLVSAAMQDPVIRRKYQFWYAFYPTGAPVLTSAAMIRQDVTDLRRQFDGKRFPAVRQIDLVGYSMGGNIARILATDIGTRLWDRVVKVPFDEVKLDPADREAIRSAVFFRPLPGVRVVVFIATPHRGTRLADASIAHWGDRLIRLPGDLLGVQSRFFAAVSDVLQGDTPMPSRLTGINALSADAPLYAAWEGLPMEKGVRFYSIIGDRGRGDTPNSSDGIVGYWSSHLEGAESELIVPTGHDAQAYPGSEQEILRILRANMSRRKGTASP